MIQEYQSWIVDKLESWATTFDYGESYDDEVREEGEKAFDYIHHLISKFETGTCTKDDYENILFHIWQSLYDEIYK